MTKRTYIILLDYILDELETIKEACFTVREKRNRIQILKRTQKELYTIYHQSKRG